MEHNYNMTDRSRKMVENYFFLIRNLPDRDKIALISKISDSIVQGQKKKKTKEDILAETYGCFQSDQSADELIEEIYNSRHFIDKNYQL